MTKYILIVSVILSLFAGFMIGRAYSKKIVKTKIEYIKGDVIHDSIPYPIPYVVVKPSKPNLPTKTDTVFLDTKPITYYIIQKVDTAKIIEEYTLENKYKKTLFNNDSIGKFDISAAVQYNKLKDVNYSFQPIQKVVTRTIVKKPIFTPFVAVGYARLNTKDTVFNIGNFGGGLFIKNFGVEYKYITNFKGVQGHEVGIKIKL